MRRFLLNGSLVVVLLLSACALRPGSGGPSPSQGIDHPAGDAPVLRIAWEGGFVAPTTRLLGLPNFLVTGDGRVLTGGAIAAVYPGPALSPVVVRQLSEEGLQGLLRAVLDSGQFGASADWTGAAAMVADAPDTVFTLDAAGRRVVVRVYGLGTLDGGPLPPGITAAEREAHRALGELQLQLLGLIGGDPDWLPAGAWLDEWQGYRPAALRLLISNADGEEPEDGGIAFNEAPWPTDGDPATFGAATALEAYRCGVVTGAAADAWWDALSSANELTRWVGGGHRYEVQARQLLPGEAQDCPAA